MSGDSSFFRTPAQMEPEGWRPEGANWIRETPGGFEIRVPLSEAKMIHHFDHRWATYSPDTSDDEEGARDCTFDEKQDQNFEPSPRYWVPEEEVLLRAARVPAALKSAVKQARGEGGKGRNRANADLQGSARATALKALVTWIAGAFPALEDRPAREADLFRLLGRAQDWRGALKASPERFLLDPKTQVIAAEMQCETPLTEADLAFFVTEQTEDALTIAEHLVAVKQPRWLLGWRDITNATNERTVVGGVFPTAGVGNNLPIWYPGPHVDGKQAAAFVGMLTSLTFDFSARHKVGGTHLNFFIAQQLPVLPPSAFSRDDLSLITPRVLELTYTSHAMKPWAEDLGYSGQPFTWNEDRRAQLRAELDAFFAKKFGLTEEELRYVLDPEKVKGAGYPSETFRGLKEKELRLHGEYRTERLVVEAWHRLKDRMFASQALAAGEAIDKTVHVAQRPGLKGLADGVWLRAAQSPNDAGAALTALLKSIEGPKPSKTIRFAAAMMLEPHLLTSLLPASRAQEWRRLVGQEAEPRIGNVVGFAARTNQGWGVAVSNHRGNGRLIEDTAAGTWAPGSGLDAFDTAGWADGRARFVLESLSSLDLNTITTSMPDDIRGWIADAATA
jgi:hypothetical protein